MDYSSINGSALGFDVVRLPCPGRVVRPLLVGLTADTTHLWALASQHPAVGASPDERPAEMRQVELVRGLRAGARAEHHGAPVPVGSADIVGGPHFSDKPLSEMLGHLVGHPSGLGRFIDTDVLGPLSEAAGQVPDQVRGLAVDLLTDAAVSAWCSTPHDPPPPSAIAVERALLPCTPTVPDLGPHTPEVQQWLTGLSGPFAAHDDPQDSEADAWVQAMHEASWAAHLSGRSRAAVTAQLLLADRVARLPVTDLDLAGWVWNRLSGIAQALVVSDLLSAPATAVLLRGHDDLR